MAIKLGQGFQITSANVIDSRLVLTKAQMKAVNDNTMPAKYFTLCSDDNLIYVYDKNHEVSAETGKFFTVQSTGNIVLRGYYYNGEFYIDGDHTVACEKSANYIYVDKHDLGAIYTWDGTQYVAAVRLDNKSIVKTEEGISLAGYESASQGQIPVKNETDGLSWIDPDKALDFDEIIEVLN